MYTAAFARNLANALVSDPPPLSSPMMIDESEDEAQIQETGANPSPHIKEVWFPGTHSDM
jgi:hypothetical protein